MKIATTYRVLNPTTTSGYAIAVTTVYSSFDEAEIDRLHDSLKEAIGTLLVTETPTESVQ